MSTRSNVQFIQWGKTQANIYVHSDGYPSWSVPRLYRFFNTVKHNCEGTMCGTRFDDACYLAAKFVVFMGVLENSRYSEGGLLDFGGVGVAMQDAGDGEYTYYVDCDKIGEDGYPQVRMSPSDDVQSYRDASREKPVTKKPAKESYAASRAKARNSKRRTLATV